MSVNEKMTALADAIREKSGQTGAMTIDKMTEVVSSISTGGGLPAGISAIEVGTFTPPADRTCPVTIPHDLGVAPNFVCLMPANDITSLSSFAGYLIVYTAVQQRVTATNQYGVYLIRSVAANGAATTAGGAITGNTRIGTERYFSVAGNKVLKGGQPYCWVAAVIDAI